ncbi:unnamed protein product [Cylicocyclus nassatus]|uniref:Uncharacterized protein n=1 Tax=Cylicocyclus nassatus TaxID=53992 RepID=A0AA36M4Y5_CYLNA|nr:unnamed protein product [Cylicocyclus nassatus]
MLTIILLALFITSEAPKVPATTILYMKLPYVEWLKPTYIRVAKKQLRKQLKRNKLPYIESMFKVNANKARDGNLAVAVHVFDVPDCSMVKEMAKKSKKSNGLISYVTVRCKGRSATYI